jgi:hypothetical protein
MNKDEERFHYAVSARLGPPPTTLFLGIEILQEAGRREAGEGAGEMELSPHKCM